MWQIIRRVMAVGLLLVGGWLWIWTSLPGKKQVEVVSLSPSAMQLKVEGETDIHSILVPRRVRLEWPSIMRIGDTYKMVLDFEQVNGETDRPVQKAGYSDAYTSYNIMAEARFEVAGIKVDPANPTRESMPPGKAMSFSWGVSAEQVGDYDGNVWLSLRFLPLDGSPPVQVPIFVREVKLHTTSMIGLNAPVSSLLVGVTVVLSVLLLFSDMMGWLRRKGKII